MLYWNWSSDRFKQDLKECSSVLDLGCGKVTSLSSFPWYKFKGYKVGVDAFQPYIDISKANHYHDEYFCCDILEYLMSCRQRFDAVYIGSVIEHIQKQRALAILKEADRVAQKCIIVITTNGFIKHHITDDNPYQIHLSGWSTKEFRELGYSVYGILGWKPLRGEEGVSYIGELISPSVGEVISNLTQYVTYRLPQLAFELYAIKKQSSLAR